MPVAANDSASSGLVTTSANGWPLPIGLPKVTMSGTTPREMHSYDLAYSGRTTIAAINTWCKDTSGVNSLEQGWGVVGRGCLGWYSACSFNTQLQSKINILNVGICSWWWIIGWYVGICHSWRRHLTLMIPISVHSTNGWLSRRADKF